MSRTGTPSLRKSSLVPPVEMISTPCFSRARAKSAMPDLSETEISARLIFMGEMSQESRNSNQFFLRSCFPEKSAINYDVLRHRVEHRAATDRLAERFAEMAQARITDFGRCFGHVVAAAAQQFRGTLHSQIAQVLRNGQPDLTRKTSAQVKRTAADFLAQLLKGWRVGEIVRQ